MPVICSKEDPSPAVRSRSSTPAFLDHPTGEVRSHGHPRPIVRLTQQLDALAACNAKSWPGKVVLIKVDGESKDAARERHYRARPEDRGADTEIFLVIAKLKPRRADGHKAAD